MPIYRAPTPYYSPYHNRPSRILSLRPKERSILQRFEELDRIDFEKQREEAFKNEILQPALDLQERSPNLVFFDRAQGSAVEFPYPVSFHGRRIHPPGVAEYFNKRRLRFECYCGLFLDLKSDKKTFIRFKKFNGLNIASCTQCNLFVCLELVYEKATLTAFYQTSEQDGAIQPASVPSGAREIFTLFRTTRRSLRRLKVVETNNLDEGKKFYEDPSWSPPPASALLLKRANDNPGESSQSGSSSGFNGSRFASSSTHTDSVERKRLEICEACSECWPEDDLSVAKLHQYCSSGL